MIRAGTCTACGQVVWRSAQSSKDWNAVPAGTTYLLWPRPDSLYAQVETETGWAPGIAYCARCAPPVGTPFLETALAGRPILRYEKAGDRYAAWYAEEKRSFYAAWLTDQLWLEPAEVVALLHTWDEDRREILHGG